MATDFLIKKGDNVDNNEIKDLQTIHIYRGRFLHWMSIIEKIMKEYCQIKTVMTYGRLKYEFICKLKKEFKSDYKFDEFVKALIEINPERNAWAHGIVFYEERENNLLPNNFIILNDVISLKNYFDKINSCFKIIISWLKENNLWEIKDYGFSKFDNLNP